MGKSNQKIIHKLQRPRCLCVGVNWNVIEYDVYDVYDIYEYEMCWWNDQKTNKNDAIHPVCECV